MTGFRRVAVVCVLGVLLPACGGGGGITSGYSCSGGRVCEAFADGRADVALGDDLGEPVTVRFESVEDDAVAFSIAGDRASLGRGDEATVGGLAVRVTKLADGEAELRVQRR